MLTANDENELPHSEISEPTTSRQQVDNQGAVANPISH